MPDELLTQQQVADELKVSVRTLQRWRKDGYGPKSLLVGRSPRYRRSEVDRWLEEQAKLSGDGRQPGERIRR